MQIDLRARGEGKTTAAVEWVKAGRIEGRKDSSDRILVVHSEQEKHRVVSTFDLGYHEVETVDTVLQDYYWPTLRKKQLYLDNADMFLETLFKGLLRGISLTKEET